jgi:hypothetical protein
MGFRYLEGGLELRLARWRLVAIWRHARMVYISPTGALRDAVWVWWPSVGAG